MATNYQFKTASYGVEDVAEVFCFALGLDRLKPLSPTPILNESWWAAVTSDGGQESPEVGPRLGSAGPYTSITFVPDKRLPWEEEVQGLATIIKAVLDLLARSPEASGYLEFYDEIIVIEKRNDGPIIVDPRLVDDDDLGEARFHPVLAGHLVAPIEQP